MESIPDGEARQGKGPQRAVPTQKIVLESGVERHFHVVNLLGLNGALLTGELQFPLTDLTFQLGPCTPVHVGPQRGAPLRR